jgi:hypothetical protein
MDRQAANGFIIPGSPPGDGGDMLLLVNTAIESEVTSTLLNDL